MAKKEIWQDIQLQAIAALQFAGLSMEMIDIATSILCAVGLNFSYF